MLKIPALAPPNIDDRVIEIDRAGGGLNVQLLGGRGKWRRMTIHAAARSKWRRQDAAASGAPDGRLGRMWTICVSAWAMIVSS